MNTNTKLTSCLNNINLLLPEEDKYYLYNFIEFGENEKLLLDILNILLNTSCYETKCSLLKTMTNELNESIFIYLFKTLDNVKFKDNFDSEFNKLNFLILKMFKRMIFYIKKNV